MAPNLSSKVHRDSRLRFASIRVEHGVPMNLSWISSDSASCCCATEAKLRGWQLPDPDLERALDSPVEQLKAALSADGVPLPRFFYHIVPLAATNPGPLELAEVVLTKTIGHEKAKGLAVKYRSLLTELFHAFDAQRADSSGKPVARETELKQQWNSVGPLYLSRIEQVCEAGLLASDAQVVLVDAAAGGGGMAYLPYNRVCLDGTTGLSTELPDEVRLAWLLSTLNLDLPKYSEQFRPGGDGDLGSLAMIPSVLWAWKDGDPSACKVECLTYTLRAWFHGFQGAGELAANLHDWWQVYLDSQISWPNALRALDQLVADTPLPSDWDPSP